ncbi:MAG: 4Fe-4S binding protein [Actinobacteria bacterium]|nr:4Fe-4S binding protein [Actinomycetota bacterium]
MVKYGAPMMVSSGYVARVDQTACVACGACEALCPNRALTLEQGAKKGETPDVRMMI